MRTTVPVPMSTPAPAQIKNFSTGFNYAAVNSASNHRRDFASRHGDHRFVEQSHASHGLSLLNQGSALPVQGKRRQIGIAKTLSDQSCLQKGSERSSNISLAHRTQANGQQQVTLLHAVGLVFE